MAIRVLVIEDNVINRELIQCLLEVYGYDPVLAVDGNSGLEMARRERPDLILSDIQMPDMDGIELAKQLKADPLLASIPLIAVTALAMVGDRDRVLAAGFDGYIPKPLVPAKFGSQLQDYLPGNGPDTAETA